MRPLLTLLTDFGVDSPYVAQLKAAAYSVCRDLTIVDITHSVPPQDIGTASFLLADIAPRFPAGTIHLAVVDPGVGTDRPIVLAEAGSQRVIAPDNGLLTDLLREQPLRAAYWLPPPEGRPTSATFHGRDIMAPIAAQLAAGAAPAALGSVAGPLRRLSRPQPKVGRGHATGHVIWVDTFGNLITDLRDVELLDMLADAPGSRVEVACGASRIAGLVTTYGERPQGALVALFGSSGRLEIAEVAGHAAHRLAVGRGAEVRLEWEASGGE